MMHLTRVILVPITLINLWPLLSCTKNFQNTKELAKYKLINNTFNNNDIIFVTNQRRYDLAFYEHKTIRDDSKVTSISNYDSSDDNTNGCKYWRQIQYKCLQYTKELEKSYLQCFQGQDQFIMKLNDNKDGDPLKHLTDNDNEFLINYCEHIKSKEEWSKIWHQEFSELGVSFQFIPEHNQTVYTTQFGDKTIITEENPDNSNVYLDCKGCSKKKLNKMIYNTEKPVLSTQTQLTPNFTPNTSKNSNEKYSGETQEPKQNYETNDDISNIFREFVYYFKVFVIQNSVFFGLFVLLIVLYIIIRYRNSIYKFGRRMFWVRRELPPDKSPETEPFTSEREGGT